MLAFHNIQTVGNRFGGQLVCELCVAPTCRALKMTTGVRGERVALLSRSSSRLFCRPPKSVGGLRVWVPRYWTELKASGKRPSFLKRSTSSLSTDSDGLSEIDIHEEEGLNDSGPAAQ